ncbi:MAG: DUF2254 domain-containing protein [Elainella sp. C42_A2020_010]|nr:DUF2254 domain-containing protein [Elainella sp. C42_A2020_010]RNJ65535.1 MAG: DUF2254 domain-containing protein [Leptolyngbya sp. IPPAS B-1204]
MNHTKLSKLWDSLHASYWFLPSVMVAAAIGLALLLLTLDGTKQVNFDEWNWLYTGGPEGARALLSAIAGSMMTVAATAFSITIVALQLASSNFGPRLLRNFMQDTGNQFVLGTFISTFIYCLLVLRTIRGEDFDFFVPQLSVTVGIVLAIVSIGVLIYFIHHASTIIQASHVITEVSQDLTATIDRLFPEKLGHNAPEPTAWLKQIPPDFETAACSIPAKHSGYLQAIDNETLMKIACQHNLLLQIKFRPGKFMVKGCELALVYPGKRVKPQLFDLINNALILGQERTEQQDVEFPIDQLVEIALRAISPGINDPFTAVRCIDRLTDGLCQLAQRDIPSPYRFDREGQLRVIVEPISFGQLVDAAFNQIRQYSRSDAAVTIRLLEAISTIAAFTHRPDDRVALHRHAEMIYQGSREGLPEAQDRNDVEERYLRVIKALKSSEIR